MWHCGGLQRSLRIASLICHIAQWAAFMVKQSSNPTLSNSDVQTQPPNLYLTNCHFSFRPERNKHVLCVSKFSHCPHGYQYFLRVVILFSFVFLSALHSNSWWDKNTEQDSALYWYFNCIAPGSKCRINLNWLTIIDKVCCLSPSFSNAYS